jgi:hypothetical protein
MARIDSYTVITPTTDDYLLGTDSPSGGGPTRNFTVQSIIDLVNDEASGNTNDYLDDITVEAGFAAPSDDADKATITFSIGSQGDQTLDLGGAAFKAADHYATSTALTNHLNDTSAPHSLDSIVSNQSLAPTKLKGITGNGTNGQLISVDGSGNFSYVDDTDANDNYYLSNITKDGNNVTFVVTGNTDVTTSIFKEAAFLTKSDIRTDVKNNVSFTTNNFTDLKALSKLDKVTVNEIQNLAVTNGKIANGTISEEKLNVTNNPTSGYVLTAGATDGTFTWAANSASNYYLDGITKSSNTLTFSINGGTDQTYTFGGAAFANIGTTANDVAAGNHNHTISSLTDAGGLATKSSVGTSEITNKSVTAGKLSPATAGTNGQVLSLNSSNELVWVNSSGTTIADVRLLPSTIGATNSGTAGTGPQLLRVNTAGTLVEYVDLSVDKNEFATGNSPAAGKVLGLDTNNDLQWIATPTPTIAADSVTAEKIDFIDDGVVATTAGHILVSDGTDFGNVAMSGGATMTSAGVVTILGHPTVSAAASSNNNGYTFIQDLTIDANGHVTNIGTTTISTANTTISNGSTTIPTSNAVYDHVATAFQNTAAQTIGSGTIGNSQLKNEFTDREAKVTLSSSSTEADLDFRDHAIFEIDLPSDSTNVTINLDDARVGDTKVIIVNGKGGTGTITFDTNDVFTGSATEQYNRLSSDDIDKTNGTINYVQVTCIYRSSTLGVHFIYTVGTTQS